MPTISVVIPAYNAARYIAAAIDSALLQTYPAVQIIVVDDGSTDATPVLLHPYSQAGKIIYVRQENKGLAAARNAGIRAASGDYIALLDADDIFLPEKLARQAAHLDAHPDCGVSYCGLWHFNDAKPDTMLMLDYAYYSGAEVFRALLKKNFINPLSVVMRRSVFDTVGYFDESLRRSEDWDFWVRAAYAGIRFDYLPERLAKYRMGMASLSYNSAGEVERKRTSLGIFSRLSMCMSHAERARYRMCWILFRHRMKLWYAMCAAYLPFLYALKSSFRAKKFFKISPKSNFSNK